MISHTGAEARAATFTGQWGVTDGPYSQGYEYDAWGNLTHLYGWGGEVLGGEPQGGNPPGAPEKNYAYLNNRRTEPGFEYDAAGNLTFDGGQHFTYDAAGRQTYVDWKHLYQGYDGDGLRVRKADDDTVGAVYYLRSSALGGQVVAEVGASGGLQRGYVFAGAGLLAVQQGGAVHFVHEDPVTKSKRVTDKDGAVESRVELDPYGAETNRSSNAAFQPKKFTSYGRDSNGTDEAMYRRYNRYHVRFDQPDPYDGSYDLSDPQSFNRYAYVQNDPANFIDPTGLTGENPGFIPAWQNGWSQFLNPMQAFINYAMQRTVKEYNNFQREGGVEFEGFQLISFGRPELRSPRAMPSLQGLLPADKKLWDCLQQQFNNARAEFAELQKREAFSVKPSASTLVSAGLGFLVGFAVTKEATGGAIGALALGGGTAIAKDVLADNIGRSAKRISGNQDIRSRLNWSLAKCYRDNGYRQPPYDIAESIGVLFN